MNEEWRAVLDGAYEVSSLGRMRRAKPGRRTFVGRFVTPVRAGNGYLMVGPTVAGRNVRTYLHHLVAEAFLGPRPVGCDINHIDGDKTNAAAANLEYVTHAENAKHAVRAGLIARGERSHSAKLSDADVDRLRARRGDGTSFSKLASEFGVSISHAYNLVTGKRRSA